MLDGAYVTYGGGAKQRKIKMVSTRSGRFAKKETANKSKDEATNSKRKKTVSNKATNTKVKRISGKKSTDLRQMSLKESFSNQPVSRRLRMRDKKNYCEDSTLQKSLPLDHQSPVVVLRKLRREKLPIYKCVNAAEDATRRGSDIYDFRFDENNSKEMQRKKRKKRIVKKNVVKTVKKRTVKKQNQKSVGKQEVPETQVTAAKEVKNSIKTVEENSVTSTVANEPIESSMSSAEKTQKPNKIINEQIPSTENTVVTEKQDSVHQKPKIVSIESLNNTGIKVVPSTGNMNASFMPFRPTHIFNNTQVQYQSMANASLLKKPLSPIVKPPQDFDPGSPWRPPSLQSFAQVRNVYSSTPHVNKLNVLHTSVIQPTNIDFKNSDPALKPTDLLDKLACKGIKENATKNIKTKNVNTASRKFGTEITNIDNSPVSLVTDTVEEQNDNLANDADHMRSNNKTSLNNVSNSQNATYDENFENKENSVPNCQTPMKKAIKDKRQKRYLRSPRHLQKLAVMKCYQRKQHVEPQPGPSGLQDLKFGDKNTLLHQSNLNNFLNLSPMPESANIKTSHGVFGDVNSMPINGKSLKTIKKTVPGVENNFGFGESDSDLDTSPNDSDPETKVVKGNNTDPKVQVVPKVPTRILMREIKNVLLKESVEEKLKSDDKQQDSKIETHKPAVQQQRKVDVDTAAFSDTFDVLSESGELQDNVSAVPLFVDLEPTHFTQPARHSYKRKRAIRFNFGEDKNNECENTEAPEVKRRKVTKLQREHEKRMKEWVRNVNETFEEIDQYDLVVE